MLLDEFGEANETMQDLFGVSILDLGFTAEQWVEKYKDIKCLDSVVKHAETNDLSISLTSILNAPK